MSFKTIVVHCDGDEAMGQRLDIASGLAMRFGSRLIGLHVRSPFQPPVFFDEGFVMNDLCKLHEDMQAAERRAVSEMLVAVAGGSKVAVTPVLVDGSVDREVTKRARCADLVVLGQTRPDRSAITPPDLPELVALSSGRPVLAVPCAAGTGSIGKSAMLCWNGSREAARAASDALPFLKSADKVTVFRVRSDDPGSKEIGAHCAARWLANHGVRASAVEETAGGVDVGALLLSRASELRVDLIVMGIYGHTRVREMIVGGTSRTMLYRTTIPILMAH